MAEEEKKDGGAQVESSSGKTEGGSSEVSNETVEKTVKTGKPLTGAKKEKIRQLAVDFWQDYGKDHKDDVDSWLSNPNGKKLISHFNEDGKDPNLFEECIEYRSCANAYFKTNSKENQEYDDELVDYAALQTHFGIAGYWVMRNLPKFIIELFSDIEPTSHSRSKYH